MPGGESDNSWFDKTLGGALQGALRGFRFGPGVLVTIAIIVVVGLPALAGVVWSLRSEPILAGICLCVGLGFLAYVVERSFRYAEKNPIPALLGGGHLLQFLKDQTAAKDNTLVIDQPPVGGTATQSSQDAARDA